MIVSILGGLVAGLIVWTAFLTYCIYCLVMDNDSHYKRLGRLEDDNG